MRPARSPSSSYTFAALTQASEGASGRMPRSTPPPPIEGGEVAADKNALAAPRRLPALRCSRPSANWTSAAHSYVGCRLRTEVKASAANSEDPCTSYMTPTPCHNAGSCSFSGAHAIAVWYAVKASPTKLASVVAAPNDDHASAWRGDRSTARRNSGIAALYSRRATNTDPAAANAPTLCSLSVIARSSAATAPPLSFIPARRRPIHAQTSDVAFTSSRSDAAIDDEGCDAAATSIRCEDGCCWAAAACCCCCCCCCWASNC